MTTPSRHPNTLFLCAILLSLLCSLLTSCHYTGEPPEPPTPGKRDYHWTVDTLAHEGSFQTLMLDIWASSPQNVYVVGSNDRGTIGAMYHFNGDKWESVKLHVSEGGLINAGLDLNAIYGFGADDIWAVGKKGVTNPNPPPNFLDSSIIIHFDGTAWRESPIRRGRVLTTLWGANAGDIWAGGETGTLYHYTGDQWTLHPFDDSLSFIRICGFNASDVYASVIKRIDAVEPTDSAQILLYHYNGAQWQEVDSFMTTPTNHVWKFGAYLWCADKLYSSYGGVYRLDGTVWNKLLETNTILIIDGSSDENIYAVGGFGKIFHWNGADWKRLTEIENPEIDYRATWTNNIETFIVGFDGWKSYVLHGK